MRHSVFILIFILSLTGCMRRTLTTVPAFSGVVVDSNTGKPLGDVKINNEKLAVNDGHFAFVATTEKIWVLLAPGDRGYVTREVVFQKKGYRDTTCSCMARAFFTEEKKASTIPMVKIDESESATTPSVLLRLKDWWVECQVFVGSRVKYNNAVYVVGEIKQQEQNGMIENFFTLWPIFPNEGDVVMDVTDYDLRLIANEPTQ